MAEFQVPTRDVLIAKFQRDVAFRAPTVDVGTKTQVETDAGAIVDTALPLFAQAQQNAEGTTLNGQTFEELQDTAEDEGLPRLLPAAGAVGFLVITAAVGGTTISAGATATHLPTGRKYQCGETRLYFDAQPVPVVAVNSGPDTDLSAGTVLQWDSPALGCGLTATVFEQSDGTGLTGGRAEETREELILRIRNSRGNPAASGNDASYQEVAKRTPGVPVSAVFTYPAIQGPGTSCLLFLLRPSKLGGSRIPSAAAIAAVKGYVIGKMPKDDSVPFGVVLSSSVDVVLRVRWAKGIAKWSDGVQWPPQYVVSEEYKVHSVGTISPSTIPVTTASGTPTAPQVGQTIALWDRANLRFVPKRILTVSGVNPWTLTFDLSNNASDQSFVPAVGDIISPWSDSLDQIPALIAAYFETLGTGEQVNTLLTSFFDEGYRERRSPASPLEWPNTITSRMTDAVEKLAAIESVTIQAPSIPFDTPPGTKGVSAYLLELAKLAIYPG
jgi:uncharacterized phage protein gp47/JayE